MKQTLRAGTARRRKDLAGAGTREANKLHAVLEQVPDGCAGEILSPRWPAMLEGVQGQSSGQLV